MLTAYDGPPPGNGGSDGGGALGARYPTHEEAETIDFSLDAQHPDDRPWEVPEDNRPWIEVSYIDPATNQPSHGQLNEEEETEIIVRFQRQGEIGWGRPLTVDLQVNGELIEEGEFGAFPGLDFTGFGSGEMTFPVSGDVVDKTLKIVDDNWAEPARSKLPYDPGNLLSAPPEVIKFFVADSDDVVGWELPVELDVFDSTRFYFTDWIRVRDPVTVADELVNLEENPDGSARAVVLNKYWVTVASAHGRSEFYGAVADGAKGKLELSPTKQAGVGSGFDINLGQISNLFPVNYKFDFFYQLDRGPEIRTFEGLSSPAERDNLYEVRGYAEKVQILEVERSGPNVAWQVVETTEVGYTGIISTADQTRSSRLWLDEDDIEVQAGPAFDEDGYIRPVPGRIAYNLAGSPLNKAPANLAVFSLFRSLNDWREDIFGEDD